MLTQTNMAALPRAIRGFSLIELMVSMLIGLIVIAGAVALIVAIDRSNSEMIQSTRINQELRTLAAVISDEVKRARRMHDPIVKVGQGGTSNGPFDFVDTSSPGCIIYGYQDATTNDASATSAVNNYEAIYLKTTGGIGSVVFAKSTSAVTCSSTGTAVSSAQLNVTDLKFYCIQSGSTITTIANTAAADTSTVQASCSQIQMRVTAKLVSGDTYQNAISHTYVQQIFIRSGAAKTS